MSQSGDSVLVELKVPRTMRPRVAEILAITDELCAAYLDREYGELGRELVARLARKRPSPLARGDVRIWAAGALYALGQINFLFDRSQQPHLTADQLAGHLGVVKTTMANKAAAIRRTLDLGYYEPGLTRQSLYEDHPLAWIVQVNGLLVDARTLPAEIQDEARRRGLIPDLQARRAA
jgi:AcrR family transcriptional regulator